MLYVKKKVGEGNLLHRQVNILATDIPLIEMSDEKDGLTRNIDSVTD